MLKRIEVYITISLFFELVVEFDYLLDCVCVCLHAHMMTDCSRQGVGLCESKSADICLMTKILCVCPPQDFVGNFFAFLVEGMLLVMLVIFWHNIFIPELL